MFLPVLKTCPASTFRAKCTFLAQKLSLYTSLSRAVCHNIAFSLSTLQTTCKGHHIYRGNLNEYSLQNSTEPLPQPIQWYSQLIPTTLFLPSYVVHYCRQTCDPVQRISKVETSKIWHISTFIISKHVTILQPQPPWSFLIKYYEVYKLWTFSLTSRLCSLIFLSKDRYILSFAFLSVARIEPLKLLTNYCRTQCSASREKFELKYEKLLKLVKTWGKFNSTVVGLLKNSNHLD